MNDFVLLFRSNDEDRKQAMGTPELAQRAMQSWLTWLRELESGGHLKSPGEPLEPTGGAVLRGQLVTDGPFIESKDIVLGFTIITARDLSHAISLAKGCPMLHGSGSVEVRAVSQRPA